APLRPGARELIDLLDRHHVRATVLSGGVDFYIAPILQREGIAWPFQTDVLRRDPTGTLVLEHPFGHATCRLCGICKAQAVRSSLPRSHTSVFVGDGSTDRFAAEVADVVFARHRLLTFCKRRGIPALPFESLEPVVAWFRARLEGTAEVETRTSLGNVDSACPISSSLATTVVSLDRVGQS
ncbi:MAG: haloacid dehalogenase-like hydrolase, partial [Thermoplasmata archaeon]|nr:haloacid dehalogenase-like hydrolase [Thermoplasmata archaeon]